MSVAHIEAGLRSHNKQHPFPEEVNRRVISAVADLHFAPTKCAAENLYREGIPADQVRRTGNTVVDALQEAISLPFLPDNLLGQVTRDSRRIILATAHRRENFGEGLERIFSAFATIAERHKDAHIVMPVHPNPNVGHVASEMLGSISNVTLLPL